MKTQPAIAKPATNRNERGIALVMTLTILLVVTVLVIAFASVMRIESQASGNYRAMLQARQIAEAGVAQGIARLRYTMPPNTFYVSAPGWVANNNGSFALYSDTSQFGGTNIVVNLNATGLIITNPAGVPPSILVNWINLTNGTALIGRYAYWIDDESTKVNINSAEFRTNEITVTFTPRDVRMTYLGLIASQCAASHTYALNTGFPTSASWPLFDSTIAGICATNIFNITSYSQSTKLTPWGTVCFNLNSNMTAAAKVAAIAAQLRDVRLKNPFPGFTQTFGEKYGNNCEQIAANIVDYIDNDRQPTTDYPANDPPKYLGLEMTPYLNEMLVSNTFAVATNNAGQMSVQMDQTIFVELRYMYPPSSQYPDYPLAGHKVTLSGGPNITFGGIIPAQPLPNPTISITGSPVMSSANDFYVLSYPVPTQTFSTTSTGPITVQLGLGTVTAKLMNGIGLIDYAQIPLTNAPAAISTITLTPAMAHSSGVVGVYGAKTNLIQATACNDPRVKPVSNNWNPLNTAPVKGTLGQGNSGSVHYIVTNTPPGATQGIISDDDSSAGSCHTNTMYRDRGWISLGELDLIHTGVPWRTLYITPYRQADIGRNYNENPNMIPDWAMLDLFTCTNEPSTGRININAQISALPGSTATNQHLNALCCLIHYTNIGFSTGVPQNNLLCRTYNPSYTPPASPAAMYSMVGQLCEVGSYTPSVIQKYHYESVVRCLANIINTRSDTFTIWVRAQAMPYGNNIVVGEAWLQTVVQRDPTAGTWRILYQRWM